MRNTLRADGGRVARRKRLTAVLREGRAVVLVDNVNRPFDSAALAAALTAARWSDRVLGLSETVTAPVRCLWLATANNPVLSTEVARRSVRIRLDPRVDRPWERPASAFAHPNLRRWVWDHRPELVWAALTLVQAWVAAGRPAWSAKTLGSFEDWSRVLGGVLAVAGVDGFLGNLDAFYEAADLEGAAWRAFVGAWWAAFGDRPVGTTELFPLALEIDAFEVEGKTERAQKTAFGKQLGRQRDRVIGNHRITPAGVEQRAQKWRLLPTAPVNVVNVSERFGTLLTRARVSDHVHVVDERASGAETFTNVHNVHPAEAAGADNAPAPAGGVGRPSSVTFGHS